MSDDQLKSFAVAVAGVVSAGYDFFVKKVGLFSFIMEVSGPSKALMGANFAELKTELLALDDTGRLDVEGAFKAALPPELLATLTPELNLFDRAVALVQRLVGCYHEVLAVEADFKALFGI